MSPALWTAVGGVGAAGAALAGWHMHRRQMPALRALDADFQCPDMRFRYTAQELFDGLDRLGAQGRALLLRFWLADAGFAVALLAVTLAAARNSMPDLSPLRMVMDAAACPAHPGGSGGKRAARPRRARLSRPKAGGNGACGLRSHVGQVVPDGLVGGRPVRRAGAARGVAVAAGGLPGRGGYGIL